MVDKAPRLMEKLLEVAGELDQIEKRGHNENQNYDFVQAADVLRQLRGLLFERGILFVPDAARWDRTEKLTTVELSYTIYDTESRESIEREWVGVGMDGGDKGIYKAYTGALKYFLLNLFLLPTGDDPENDSQQAVPEVPPITDDQVAELAEMFKASDLDKKRWDTWKIGRGLERTTDFSQADYAEAVTFLQANTTEGK